MDNEKKEVLIGIDVFLWIVVFIPGAVYVTELIHAYRDGVNIAGFFTDNAVTYYGWEGVKAEIDLILWLGAFRFYLWLALLIIATIYTIFLAYKLKTNK